jgi:hypothetical protein
MDLTSVSEVKPVEFIDIDIMNFIFLVILTFVLRSIFPTPVAKYPNAQAIE